MSEKTVSGNQVQLDREELRAFLADELEVEPAEVTDDARFGADLGVDSLVAMELIVQLERRYRISMDEAELAQITSLNSIYDLIAAKLEAA